MKTWLVIKREYWTRVRKKSFIIITLLVPLLFVAFFAITIGVQLINLGEKNIAVLDETGLIGPAMKSTKSEHYYTYPGMSLEAAQQIDSIDAVLVIPAFDIKDKVTFDIFSKEQFGLGTQNEIQQQINKILVGQRIAGAGVDMALVDELRRNTVTIRAIDKEGKISKSQSAMRIGYASGILLYMFMFFYGMSVMQSVMEEKKNRIAEIIVSSVRPFQLMLGKIVGVALVGLTQFAIWVVVIGILFLSGSVLLAGSDLATNPDLANQLAEGAAMSGGGAGDMMNKETMALVMKELMSINWGTLISWFVFYFLGGYFLYASLFAAVGSLVDDDAQESQSLTLPITMPIILGFMILMTTVKNPNSGLAIFGSIFPFTSPIVMMGRVPYGVTGDMVWQLALSAVLLVGGFILTTWFAAKIYRTGILLYGKKVTLKELGKWIFKKTS